jgi:DNA-binding beta-propeller fold protein YncE
MFGRQPGEDSALAPLRGSSVRGRPRSSLLVAAAVGAAVALGGACGSTPSGAPATAGGDAGPDGHAGAGAGAEGGDPLEPAPPAPLGDAARRDDASTTVAFDRLRGGVWTANGDVGTVTYADVDRQKAVREIAVGQNVTSVALSPDLKWIAAVDRSAGAVALVDADTGAVRRSITVGTHPRSAVWDARDPRWLYVSLEDEGAIAVVDRTLGVLHHTVAVGRLPAGLAVSRQRRELAVLHRIDARVSLLPIDGVYAPADQGAPAVEVPLAYQPPQSDATVPNGAPFAFESLAWAADGNVAWVPHELLANHHPFEFHRTLFPAVSVVDLSARTEVATDPNAPAGVIAGRKLLFDAINILDPVGNTTIVSQPCAAAMHPNGLVAYVVACASEDLLTFDVTSGMATDLLRNLPGDHPSGIALDDTGQRAFVLSDQSHTLVTVDLAGGSPVGHTAVVAGPLALVANDPVDPEMRAGYKLFFGANSTKNPLATTGNDWMSCGGCHLDGFVSTNQVFFDALSPLDPRQDAQIGHVGLRDLFSTVPTPSGPSFDPHDVLVALLDQGGLAPDRSGTSRVGQIDPSHPTDDARLMATRLAEVIKRDLPLGPSWLLAPGDPPDPTYDADWCGKCHQPEYDAWKKSAHAHAAKDAMVTYGVKVEQTARGAQYSRTCAGCHDPVSARLGDTSFAVGRGITCRGCHDVDRLLRAGGNADLETATYDWTQTHLKRADAQLAYLRTPDFCAGCHQQFVPGSGIVAINTLAEWQASPFGAGATHAAGSTRRSCVDCHMPDDGSGIHDHSAPGGNVYVATQFGEADFANEVGNQLRGAIQLQAAFTGDGVHVTVLNVGAGHAFPTGVTDIREPWIELQAIDAMGHVLGRYGGVDPSGLLPAESARFGMDIASADGTLLYHHELTDMTRIPFARFVPSLGSVDVVIPVPALPGAFTELDAVLYYRNVRTPYYRAASGDATGHAPDVEVARAMVGNL